MKGFTFWNLIKSLWSKPKPEDLIYAGTPEGVIHRLYLNGSLIPNVYIWDKKNKIAWVSLSATNGGLFMDENNKLILGSYYLPEAVLKKADEDPFPASGI